MLENNAGRISDQKISQLDVSSSDIIIDDRISNGPGDGKYRHLYVAVQLTKRNWLFIKAPILGVQWQSLKSEAKT